MPLPLVEPEAQFIDANGVPFAGGTIDTFIPGTDTPKDTWSDLAGTVLNTNPIVLDAAGRALIYGSGDYRFVLKDAAGNLIYDQLTSAIDTSAFVSAADMAAAIQAETDRAMAAENALSSSISAETTRAEAAEATLTADLNAEIARAEAAEANLQSQISSGGAQGVLGGGAVTDSSGHGRVTFSTPFSSTPSVVASQHGTTFDIVTATIAPDTSGFDIWLAFPLTSGVTPAGSRGFWWIAVGPV